MRGKTKIPVSKKDSEDLAHFIVDNVAEGDVPDSEDFERFSATVSPNPVHPKCSG